MATNELIIEKLKDRIKMLNIKMILEISDYRSKKIFQESIKEFESEIKALESQVKEPSDSDVEKWIDEYLNHETFKHELPGEDLAQTKRHLRYGIRTGAKAMRDGKIKTQTK